jgi:hypothetical protein
VTVTGSHIGHSHNHTVAVTPQRCSLVIKEVFIPDWLESRIGILLPKTTFQTTGKKRCATIGMRASALVELRHSTHEKALVSLYLMLTL